MLSADRKVRLMRNAGIFLLTVTVRWTVILIAYLLGDHGGVGEFPRFLTDFMSTAGDAPHYLQIAATGYQTTGDTANNIVFYPLYPLLMRGMGLLLGSDMAGGFAVSSVALGFAGVAVWSLCGELSPDTDAAWWGLAFFLLYPFGMFLTGVYTESLFVLCSALCLLMLYRRRWGWMALSGFMAAVTRTQGLVLLLPAAYEWLTELRHTPRADRLKRLAALLAIPAGTGVFLLLNLMVTGDALAFVSYEAAAPWYNTTQWIAGNLTGHYGMAVDDAYLGVLIYWVQLVLYFLGVAGIFAGLYRGERTSFMAYGGAYICVSYLHGWLISGPRYMLGCLPLFLLAARMKKGFRMAVLLLSALLTMGYTIMYLNGGAIM